MILSGFTPCNTTFLGDTRADIATNLISILTANGWSVVVNNSATDQVLQSSTTPAGQKVRVHIKDPGSGNCAQILPQKASAGVDLTTLYLLPGSTSTYRVIANPYQFFVFRDAVVPAAREFCCVVVPFCPPGVAAISSDIFFAACNGRNDGDTGGAGVTFLSSQIWTFGCVEYVIGGNVWNYNSDQYTNNYGVLQFAYLVDPGGNSNSMRQFQDNSFVVTDALVGWNSTTNNSNALSVGWIWDAILIYENPGPAIGTVRNFPIAAGGGNHTWFVLGNTITPALALLTS
jgi:hypothetical protein